MTDKPDPMFIVNFGCTVQIGEDDTDTYYHSFAECLIRAKNKKLAEEWGAARRERFVNPQPDAGPAIDEADQVEVVIKKFEDFVTALAEKGAELE